MKSVVPTSRVEVAEVTGQDEGLRKRFLDLLEARPDEVPETAQPPEQGAAPETPKVAHTGVANALVPAEIVRGGQDRKWFWYLEEAPEWAIELRYAAASRRTR